jgi:hypothetical protein
MNLLEKLTEAEAIAWDTCHKIYILMDEEEVEKMVEYGYEDDMVKAGDLTPNEMLDIIKDWYANSCGLRFIQEVWSVEDGLGSGFNNLIEQGEEWVYA